MTLPPGIADYEFVRVLDTGNHAHSFLAPTPSRLPIGDQYVTVKVYADASTDETYRRAVHELRAFAGVRSPHLVRLIEAGHDGDCLYLVSQYHQMGSLAMPTRPVDLDHVIRAVADAALAAHDLHEAGIAHQAIRPSAVMLTEQGGKLADPGLTSTISPGRTTSGDESLSAVEYLDPAIVRGEQPTRASDIYALGITLHRAIAGTGVFGEIPDRKPVVALRRVLTDAPAISPLLDDDTAAVVRACLAPEPSDRPATAARVAEMVSELRHGSSR